MPRIAPVFTVFPLSVLYIAFACLFLWGEESHAATSYTIPNGGTVEINEHGTCRQVTNNSGGSRWVSTKTSGEWASVVSNPNGLAMAACVSYSYGGWGSWSGCSATCGGGTQSRAHACVRSTDGASVDCSYCGGVCSQTQACNTQACAPTAGQWAPEAICAMVGQGLENCPSTYCSFSLYDPLPSCSPVGAHCAVWDSDTTWTFSYVCQ